MRNEGGHNIDDMTSEEPQGIIIDRTNKYTVGENWLFERDNLSVFDKLIYVVLKPWANCESIWPSHKTIAKQASVSVTIVKKTLAGLIDKKLISAVRLHPLSRAN
jgi:hypothetical protein